MNGAFLRRACRIIGAFVTVIIHRLRPGCHFYSYILVWLPLLPSIPAFRPSTYVCVCVSAVSWRRPTRLQSVYGLLLLGCLFFHIHSCGCLCIRPFLPFLHLRTCLRLCCFLTSYNTFTICLRPASVYLSLFTDIGQRVILINIYSCGCNCIRPFLPSFHLRMCLYAVSWRRPTRLQSVYGVPYTQTFGNVSF